MVGPIQMSGLGSGLDISGIIDALLKARQAQITKVQTKIADATSKKTDFLSVSANLLSIKLSADALSRPSFFAKTKVQSSNDNVLYASGEQVSTTGAFQFTVSRLAQSHQLISSGYADADKTAITTTDKKITMEIGGGYLDNSTSLVLLNGQTGIDRGHIKITDSSGKSAVIDLQSAVTVQDVLDAINNQTQVAVRASVSADRIVLQDFGGGSASNFKVEDYGADQTATTLGIAGIGVSFDSKNYIFGSDINYITNDTKLSILNDGLGVRRNSDGVTDIKITDTDNVSFEVDIKASGTTLQYVIDTINTAAQSATSSLRARLNAGATGIELYDAGGAQNITVEAINSSLAAVDLGLAKVEGTSIVQVPTETNGTENRLEGLRLIPALNSILRRTLNGGQEQTTASDIQGVREGSIRITDRQGDQVQLNVSSRIGATLASGSSVGQTTIKVSSLDGFAVGNKIRIAGGGNLTYRTVTKIDTATNTVYFDKGLDYGYSAGQSVYAENLSLNDIINVINDRAQGSNVNVSARINNGGNGLYVMDISGGMGNLSVSGVGGSYTAADLGIEYTVSKNYIDGNDIDPQYIGVNTFLNTLNSGRGVYAGKFRVFDTTGKQFDIDLSQYTDDTILDVIDEINNGAQAAGSGVRARINDTGDGLLIEDTTPGSGTLRIEDLYGGTTAKDLNIVGSAPSLTPAKIDGSFEFNIDIKASSTLNDIVSAINSKGIPVTAAVINDQSAYNPYKLTIFSMTTGKAGRLVVDTDISDLAFSTTTTPQDAVLLFGGQSGTPGTTDPILISSSSNTITNTVPGLTLDLLSVSSNPVTVTISRDTQGIIDQVSSFVNAYNTTIDKIAELTKFDPSTYKTGPLFADSTIRTVQRDLASLVSLPVSEIPSSNINSLQQIGVRVVSGGKLSFDESALRSAMDTKFDQVRDLFILQRRLKLDTSLQDINNGRGVQTVIGNDFQIRLRNGTTLDIDVSSNDTIGSLLSKINYATGNNGQLTASISSDGFSIVLTDSTTGSYTLKVTAQNGSLAAADLRIDKEAPSGKNVITGDLINLKNDPGVGFRISERLDFITMSDGLIDTKTDSIDKQIEGYNKDEKKLEDMMEKERERLTKQYAALDALISQSQATMQRLQSIFGGMSTTTSK